MFPINLTLLWLFTSFRATLSQVEFGLASDLFVAVINILSTFILRFSAGTRRRLWSL